MRKVRDKVVGFASKAQVPFHLKQWRWFRLVAFVTLDLITIAVCYIASYFLRFDSFWPTEYTRTILSSLVVLAAISIPVYFFFGMYRQVWRYASFSSAVLISKSILASVAAGYVAIYLIPMSPPIPRSVPLIYALLSILVTCFGRFSWRAFATFQARYGERPVSRCIIYGAGSGGDILARHINAVPSFPYHVVGFIDDDENKKRRILHGFPILGPGKNLVSLCQENNVDTVLIAMPSASGGTVRNILHLCREAGAKPLVMPDLKSTFSENAIRPRPVDVNDLLRRSPKETDQLLISEFFKNQTVLITGAGGTIGSELSRQVALANPKSIILFDHSEFNLYRIELELRDTLPDGISIVPVLASVTDRLAVERVFSQYRPKLVLHAAAYKHVPMIESNPIEGAINNIMGTKIVAEASVRFGVKRFLLVSTDKAVRPTNIMGCTKRACELLIQAMHVLNQNQCRFCSVRFGNVLGSSGSVVPRFIEQIAKGGPVTVTHPEVTRFFMLTSEAVSLVLQSIAMSTGGETFVLNMGEPVKIYEMAQELIRLAGKEPGKDVEIQVTGLRPGEKLYEELILEGAEKATVHDDVFIATAENPDPEKTLAQLNQILEFAAKNEASEMIRLLRQISSGIQAGSGAEPRDNDSAINVH